MKKCLIAILISAAALCGCAPDDTTAQRFEGGPAYTGFESPRTGSCLLLKKVQVGAGPEWRTIRQVPRPITPAMEPDAEGIHVIAAPEAISLVEEGLQGMKVRVLNYTDEARKIPTLDYCLYLVQEARDSEGIWRPIEQFPAAICSFSYFSVLLEPKEYWEFDVPRYTGTFKTRLRFALLTETGHFVYSQEFVGAVNPGQYLNNPTDPEKLFLPGHSVTLPI